MSHRFEVVAVGGVFDRIHKGHRALLTKAFEVGRSVLIGLVSDEFATNVEGKILEHSYEERLMNLKRFLEKSFPNRDYKVSRLDDYFGPEIFTEEVEAIVVSEETVSRVGLANELRIKKGLKPLEVIVVKMVLAEDGRPISTTRIRRGEIDEEGRVILNQSI
ncbi:MAG: phosphopantetheine adenylyltransferase [Nitrososphaerota archaeon]|nr:phosphopantetheine adenylyltransferase [Nitrososphaerales archaeon]MCX8191280.1 phosphopantetheine adenylyltransferase [Nitrososphaerales archaeon]MDW8044432.1 phosphopantetheine adenylyltransferase [Nitrososphaerota archaeon]